MASASLRTVLSLAALALAVVGCRDGVRLNHDMDMRKRLAGTSLAFVRSDVDLPMELAWDRGPHSPDEPIFPGRDAHLRYRNLATVAWDREFAVGTAYVSGPGATRPSNFPVTWYVLDLRGKDGPRVAYDGEDRVAYDSARAKLGVPPTLVPKPLIHSWPNWAASPKPFTREDVAPYLDPQTGNASTVRAIPLGQGYFVQDALRTFLWLSKDPPDPKMSPSPVPLTRRTSDVFRIGWDDRYIVADVCFLVSDGCMEPTVDRTMPVASVVVDTKTGECEGEVNRRSVAKLRRKYGVPDALQPRDVVVVWPDWPQIRRPWRKDAETMKYLGLE